ncbi:quinone oxidoreductase family protein [Jonesia quinghaiensis]|uniref:quinone oxidoreductase family protein n=1 Tax=Jonesia quinghaiensis TaxID=262806 RepID=UPI000410F990|nr:quinone oxidoreductase [Jonesia quinghaiensis]
MTTNTPHRIIATSPGRPEVLTWEPFDLPTIPPGYLLVETHAAGVNYIDTYLRSGTYPMHYPGPLGFEGAGTIMGIGDEVGPWAVGDHVAWASAPGSYATHVLVPVDNAIRLPESLDLTTAAALPLQGLTAHYLAHDSHNITADDWVLIHAGAGGVGLLLTQLAKSRGARVITTVSTEHKEELSRSAGADHVIRYDTLDDLTTELPALITNLTTGRLDELGRGPGVDAVYDGVGRDTFDASLASLRTRGTMVLYGGASGQVPPFDLQRLNHEGSLTITRPSLGHFTATHTELQRRADELINLINNGDLTVRIGQTWPLPQAAEAHRALESRKTTGKTLLMMP